MPRRLTFALLLAALLAAALPAAAAAAPEPGLYQGRQANGLTVALTVVDTPQGRAVSRIGALCVEPTSNDTNLDGAEFRAYDRDGDLTYLVGPDGRFGDSTPSSAFNSAGGAIDGTAGTLVIAAVEPPVRACAPAAYGNANAQPNYAVAVQRVGPARAFRDGTWKRTPAATRGTLHVWGGGSFIGIFDGGPYIGTASRAECQTTPAMLRQGALLSAAGAYTLPWERGAGAVDIYHPRTPTRGTIGASSGTWTWTHDPPSNTTLDCPSPTTTEPIALQTAQPIGPVIAPEAPPPPPPPPPLPPGTKPTTRCADGQFRVTAGRFVLCATARPVSRGGVTTLRGRVTINGLLYTEGDTLRVSPSRGTIQAGGQLTLGVIIADRDFPIARTRLELREGSLGGFSLPVSKSLMKLGGLPLDLSRLGGRAPRVEIDLNAGRVSVSAGLQYRLGAGSASTMLAAQGSVAVGTGGISASLSTEGFSVPLRVRGRQLFTLKKLAFGFDQPSDTWSLSGGAEIALPGGLGGSADASAQIVAGRLDALALALKARGGGVPGPYGTYLAGGSFSLGNLSGGFGDAQVGVGLDGGWPFRVPKKVVEISFGGSGAFDVGALSLTLAAQAAVTAAGEPLASGDASLLIDFDEPLVELEQNVNVQDLIFGTAQLRIEDSRMLSRAELQLKFGPDSVPIRFIHDYWPFGFFKDPPSELGPFASAEALLSEVGAGARGQIDVWKVELGATVVKVWGQDVEVDAGFGESRSIDFLAPGESARAAQGAAVTRRVRVARGRQALVVSAGGSATGSLVVRDPRGRVVLNSASLGAGPQELSGGRTLWARRTDRGEAGAIFLRPRPGRWRITTSGPAPFASLRTTEVRRPGDRLARIAGVRGRRKVRPGDRVRLRVRVPRGTTAELRGRRTRATEDVGRRLGAARRSGTVRVRIPRDWRGKRMRLLAVTRRDGAPVGTRASKATLRVRRRALRAPRRVTVTRGKKRLTVRWRRARGAARYVVRVRARGRRWETVARRTRARMPLPLRGRRVVVEVRGVSADGRVGPRGRKRVRARR